MHHDEIVHWQKQSSIRLLRSENAPLIISFLYRILWIVPNRTITEVQFLEQLDIYLEVLHEEYPDKYQNSPKAYLDEWCDIDHYWLRRYRSGQGAEYVLELTTHSERVLAWFQDLQQGSFVGTESRFQQIIDLLDDLVVQSNPNVETRLERLEQEKRRIQEEINEIKRTNRVEQYDEYKIRERFQLAVGLANDLIRDFTVVEDQFRNIAQDIQKAQLEPELRKGQVVGRVLDQHDELRESPVGRSFYAFWSYMQSPSRKDELNGLLQVVFALPEIENDASDTFILRHLTSHLVQAGVKVDQSSQRIASQLRRLLDEANVAEQRRVKQLIVDIKRLAFLQPDFISQKNVFSLEALPKIQLAMERSLYEPPEIVEYDGMLIEADTNDVSILDLNILTNPFFVDERRLQQNIRIMLDKMPQISLAQLLAEFPAQQGLPEVAGYVSIAYHEPFHTIDDSQREDIIVAGIESEMHPSLQIKIPQIIFRREALES